MKNITFQIEVKNLPDLYAALKSGKEHKIGGLLIESVGINYINTVLKPAKDACSLEGTIKMITSSNIPFEEIEKKLDSQFYFRASSKNQVILEKDDLRYTLQLKLESELGIINFNIERNETSEKTTVSKEEFGTILDDYAKILNTFVEACASERKLEIPKMVYSLGIDIEDVEAVTPERTYTPLVDHTPQEVNTGAEQTLEGLEALIEIKRPNVSFDQIGGCEKGKEKILQVYEDIINPEVSGHFGIDPQENKGILITGNTGSGKTMLVTALVTKLKKEFGDDVKYYSVKYSDITSKYRGEESQKTAQLFQLIRRNENLGLKTILVIDEVHAIGSRRKESSVKDEALENFLANFGGMENNPGLTLIGTTNRPEELDEAFARRIGLTERIHIDDPDYKARVEIFDKHIRQRRQIASFYWNKKLFGDIDLERLAEETEGFNGYHISDLIRRAVMKNRNETKKMAGVKPSNIRIFMEFEPITTEYILDEINSYDLVQKRKEIGSKRSFRRMLTYLLNKLD